MMDLALLRSHLMQTFPLNWGELPPDVVAVGGWVRNELLGRSSVYVDVDLVVSEGAIALARRLADRHRTGFVVLDAERQIARLVFPQGKTLDIAQQEGETLAQDLGRRDFTINAIAYHIAEDRLIDPLGGQRDLDQRQLRMIARTNLQADPLRLLRAYRQASQLAFTIEPKTALALGELASHLAEVAAERVQQELHYLFNASLGDPWLGRAIASGLLASWLPTADPDRLALLERHFPPHVGAGVLAQARLLSCLALEPDKVIAQLLHLKYPRALMRGLETVVRALQDWPQLPTDLRGQYFLFQTLGEHFPLWWAMTAPQWSALPLWQALAKRYGDPGDGLAHPEAWVNGHDLIHALNLPPGPHLRYWLTEVQIAQLAGRLGDPEPGDRREVALTWIQRQIKIQGLNPSAGASP